MLDIEGNMTLPNEGGGGGGGEGGGERVGGSNVVGMEKLKGQIKMRSLKFS